MLYTLTHLAVLWDDETVREQAAQVVETLAGFIERNDTYDVVAVLARLLRCLSTAGAFRPMRL